MTKFSAYVLFLFAQTAAVSALAAPYAIEPFSSRPDSVVDLRTSVGAELLGGKWQYLDASIHSSTNHAVGSDLKPSGSLVSTFDVSPHIGEPDFESATWQTIGANELESRRGNGKLSFAWYRISLAIPERVGTLSTMGSTALLSLTVDDYAEVWINGELPKTLGGDSRLVSGWNAPTKVLLGNNLRPGEKIDVAIFAANGPLSHPPENFVWIRDAAVEFYGTERAHFGEEVETTITRLDPELDEIVAPGTKIQRLAGGFGFAEGPVWIQEGNSGSLLFSDPNNNRIYRLTDDGQLRTYRDHSGYAGVDINRYHQPGSNGLAIDRDGRLTICEHGNRRVTRLEKNGTLTILSDRFDGMRLNSPNDLVYRSDGALFFTDPPFGLPGQQSDTAKETPFSGIYCLIGGELKLVSRELSGPNGLAFSPDERFLYVGNWQDDRKVVLRYVVNADGTAHDPTVFADLTSAPGEEAIDGIKVDSAGHVFVSGPGGLWIFAADGRKLGCVRGPELAANFTFGGPSGHELLLTARTSIYRLSLANHPSASGK